jgi:hypothetical protein
VSLNTGDLLFNNKTVSAFLLFVWLTQSSKETIANAHKVLADDLASGGKIFGSQIVKEVPLSQFKEAILESAQIATDGKILINTQ